MGGNSKNWIGVYFEQNFCVAMGMEGMFFIMKIGM